MPPSDDPEDGGTGDDRPEDGGTGDGRPDDFGSNELDDYIGWASDSDDEAAVDENDPGDEHAGVGDGEDSNDEESSASQPIDAVDNSYRNRSQGPSADQPRGPDPHEPLELNLDDHSEKSEALGGDSDPEDSSLGESADDEPPETFDLDDGTDHQEQSGTAGEDESMAETEDEESGPTGGRVLGTSLESPASSDEILDELESPEQLSGVERVAEGVVDVADQVDLDRGSDTGRFDTYAYRRFGPRIRAYADRFAEYRETVNKARLEETYDEYLSRVVLWTVLFAGVGALVGMVFATGLVVSGVASALSLNVPTPRRLVSVFELLRVPALYAVSMGVTAVVFASVVAVTMYSYPRRQASQRRREIDHLLPQTVTYMYALSQGELSIPAIIRQVAGDVETYGEVAREFQAVVNEMDFRGKDLREALRAARDATPSDELSILLDDMINVESTGGKLSPFFRDKVEKYQYEARRQKRQYLDTLEQFSELYVTLTAAMVFVVTMITIYVSLTGKGLLFLALFLYIGLPMVSVAGWVMMDSVSLTAMATTETLRVGDDTKLTVGDVTSRLQNALPDGDPSGERARADGGAAAATAGDPSPARVYSRTDWTPGELSTVEQSRLSSLRMALRRQRVVETLKAPVRRIQRQPEMTMAFTLPAVAVYLGIVAATGILPVSVDVFTSSPAWSTTVAVVVPLIIVLSPIAYFQFFERRRRQKADKQLPGMLRKLSAATDSGATLGEAIAIVANSSDTYLADELRYAYIESDIWNLPRDEALIRMTDRVRNPRLARVMQLVIEAAGSTDYLRDTLEIAATDVRNAYQMEKDRRADTKKYMALIVMTNLAFLVIAAVLAVFIIPRMAISTAATPETLETASTGPTANLLFGETPPTSLIQMYFMHGAIILAVSTGLLAGKIGFDDVRSGAAFALAKVLLVTGVFLLL